MVNYKLQQLEIMRCANKIVTCKRIVLVHSTEVFYICVEVKVTQNSPNQRICSRCCDIFQIKNKNKKNITGEGH